jgi:RecA-family ATPase
MQMSATNRAMALQVFEDLGIGPRRGNVEPPLDERPPVEDFDAFGEAPEHGEVFFEQPTGLHLVCPPAWRDVPLEPMRWLATNRIPAGDVTILSGDGGGGKTTVALQLAVSVERGLGDWLGTTCERGPVIFFSGEEPESEMRRRLHRVARKRALDPADLDRLHFHFADPDACLLGIARPGGTMGPTPLFEALAAAAKEIRPALIAVDSIAATFGGNQNDRVHARTFVGLFRTLARDIGCAILLLDHPSLSGITSGTGRGGSMDWQNATRARLHLETVEGEDGATGRVLEVKKTNYGPCGEKVRLQWDEGCFVLQGTASAPHQAAANASADQRYLECLDAVTAQGRHVCPGKGRGYAPKEFAEMTQANGMTARAFQAAQERLFAAGAIEAVPYGPPSRGTKLIARRAQ